MNEPRSGSPLAVLATIAAMLPITGCGDGMAVPTADGTAPEVASPAPLPALPDTMTIDVAPPLQRFDSSTFNLITTIGKGRGVKSVQVSQRGDVAVACDLEGCAIWVIDCASMTIRHQVALDRHAVSGYNDKGEVVNGCIAEKPVDCAIDPAGEYVYVSLYNGDAVVRHRIDGRPDTLPGADRTFGATRIDPDGSRVRLALPAARTGHMPKMVSLVPGSDMVLASNWVSGTLTAFDRSTMKRVKDIPLGRGGRFPRGIAVDSVERRAYVNNMGGASVSVVDLDSLKVVRSMRISSNPGHIHLAADRRHFYIADNVNRLFSKYAIADGSLQGQVRFDHNALLFGVDRREEVAVVLHWYHDLASVVRLSDMRRIHQFPVRRPIGVSFTGDRCLISTYGGGAGQVSVWGDDSSGIR